MMTTINNLILGLLRRQGVTNVRQASRQFAAHPDQALALILRAPT
jgi:hypothetical protein